MVEPTEAKTALKFSSRGLLVQDKDGTVYFFDGAILENCRRTGLSRKANRWPTVAGAQVVSSCQ